MTRPRIVCLAGPTASGKTALALEIGPAIGAEVVSADSRQIYRHLDVGTAKPTAAERARVRHHCLDLVDPEDAFDAARFRVAAMASIADVHRRGGRVLVVGGTGLYLRALLGGLCPAPPRVPALRAVLRRLLETDGTVAWHRRLAHVDPTAARRIHPNDAVRIVRALEVALSSGRRLSAWQAEHAFGTAPYESLTIGLAVPSVVLATRIARRAEAMMDAFADEVRGLLARGTPDDAPCWRTVGYREVRAHVEGRTDRAAAVAAMVQATRRFAKRQRTWLRAEPTVVWRDPDRDRAAVVAEVTAFLARRDPEHVA